MAAGFTDCSSFYGAEIEITTHIIIIFLKSTKSLSAHYVSHTSGLFLFVLFFVFEWENDPPFWKHLCQFHSLSFFLVTMRPLTLKSAVSFEKHRWMKIQCVVLPGCHMSWITPVTFCNSDPKSSGKCQEVFWVVFFLRTSSFAMSWISWNNFARQTRVLSNIPALF